MLPYVCFSPKVGVMIIRILSTNFYFTNKLLMGIDPLEGPKQIEPYEVLHEENTYNEI